MRARAMLASPGSFMSRDDALFWFSIVWFFGLCGAAAWALLWL
jgi:hypothetical protein